MGRTAIALYRRNYDSGLPPDIRRNVLGRCTNLVPARGVMADRRNSFYSCGLSHHCRSTLSNLQRGSDFIPHTELAGFGRHLYAVTFGGRSTPNTRQDGGGRTKKCPNSITILWTPGYELPLRCTSLSAYGSLSLELWPSPAYGDQEQGKNENGP